MVVEWLASLDARQHGLVLVVDASQLANAKVAVETLGFRVKGLGFRV